MPRIKELSDDKLVMWNPKKPHETALVYTPPDDWIKRLYNSP